MLAGRFWKSFALHELSDCSSINLYVIAMQDLFQERIPRWIFFPYHINMAKLLNNKFAYTFEKIFHYMHVVGSGWWNSLAPMQQYQQCCCCCYFTYFFYYRYLSCDISSCSFWCSTFCWCLELRNYQHLINFMKLLVVNVCYFHFW